MTDQSPTPGEQLDLQREAPESQSETPCEEAPGTFSDTRSETPDRAASDGGATEGAARGDAAQEKGDKGKEVAALEKDSDRQSTPPSSDEDKAHETKLKEEEALGEAYGKPTEKEEEGKDVDENYDDEEEEEEDDDEDEDDKDDDEDEDEDDDDEDDDDEDEEPRLKYARLTQHLSPVYRNGDATSSFLVAGDKMVLPISPHRPDLKLTSTDCWNPQRQHCES